MKFVRGAADRERVSGVDITPLVDVVFLLIIFFLTTSTLVRQTVAEVDLPEQAGNEEAESEDRGLVVNIGADGGYIVDGGRVGLERVLEMVGAEARLAEGGGGSLEMLVRSDERAPMSSLNALARGLVELDVRAWRLATRTPGALGGGGVGVERVGGG